MGLGPWELILILILLIFFYGGRKLPQIGEGLGKGISELKRALRDSTPASSGIEEQNRAANREDKK